MTEVKEKSKKELQEYLTKRYKKQNNKIKETYDRISVTLPKGTKERIKLQGESINGYINRLVLADLERLEQERTMNSTKQQEKAERSELPEFMRN